MPFKSKAQQRLFFAKFPEMAKWWAAHTPEIKALPEKAEEKAAAGLSVVSVVPRSALPQEKAAAFAPDLPPPTGQDWQSKPYAPGSGFGEWYARYAAGQRHADDGKQIARWKAFRAAHGSLFAKNPTEARANALKAWAIDPDKFRAGVVKSAQDDWTRVRVLADSIAADLRPEVEAMRRSFVFDEPAIWLHTKTARSYVPTEDRPLPEGFGEEPWAYVKLAEGWVRPLFEKTADRGLLSTPFSLLQLTPNRFNGMFGGPTPLASSLAGGLLGAGLGYGAGRVGEALLGPNVLEPGRLRKRTAVLGALLGAAPGAYVGSIGARLNAQDGKDPAAAFFEPNRLFGDYGKTPAAAPAEPGPSFDKEASAGGGMFAESIPVDAFNRAVWQDPYTPDPIRALAAGVVSSAAQAADKPWFISPYDVGKIAVGMGGGLVSGMLVGKVFGALAGLTPEAQSAVQRTGLWAGTLQQAVPLIFGGR